MQIWIRNDCPDAGVDLELIRSRLGRAMVALGLETAELSVWLCGDDTIRELHQTYLGVDAATNVISFSQREGEFADIEPNVLGDIVVSVDTAGRDALEAGTSLDDEVTFLLVHGLLHLVGYDHEGGQAHRAEEMEAKEAAVFRAITG